MRRTPLIVALLLVVSGLVMLWGLQWKHELGSFASNPQMMEVPVGARRIAAGGRALVAVRAATAEEASLVISCRDAAAEVTVALGMKAEPTCGVTIAYLTPRGRVGDADDPLRAVLEARWDE